MENTFRKFSSIAILLFCVVFIVSCSGSRLQTVKEETEANKILDILREHGIVARKEIAGEGEQKVFDIYIDGGKEEYGAAIQLMEDHCLPQPLPPEVESTGIVSSIEVEKAQELRRTKIDIESLLRSFPGATCVVVKIVPPEDRSLALNPYKASATVSIKHKTEKFGLTVNQIANTVAGGVPGLTADNVEVALTRQPLRPLPDLDHGRNLRRIFWVVGIGLTTILLFVGLAVYLRKRKDQQIDDDEIDELDDGDPDQLEENQSFESALNEQNVDKIEDGTAEESDESENTE